MADFKAPVFEPGGSMQQGMYTPKGRTFMVVLSQVTCCPLGGVTEVVGENNVVVLMYHVLVIGINGLRNLTVTFIREMLSTFRLDVTSLHNEICIRAKA